MDVSHITVGVLTSMLNTVIAPVALIGGIAFLFSIMATRYGRCIDRVRALLREIEDYDLDERARIHHVSQINVLYSRLRYLRGVMTLAGCSIFGIVITVCASFANLLIQFPSPPFIVGVFIVSLALLVTAVFGFTHDVAVSLRAIKIEIKATLHHNHQRAA